MAACCERQVGPSDECMVVTSMTGREDSVQHGMISSALHSAVVDKLLDTINIELQAVKASQKEIEWQLQEWITKQGDVPSIVKAKKWKMQDKLSQSGGDKDEISLAASSANLIALEAESLQQSTSKDFQSDAPVTEPSRYATPYGRVRTSVREGVQGESRPEIARKSTVRPPWQQAIHKFVELVSFDAFFGCLILANAVCIGAEVEYSTKADEPSYFYVIAQYFFCFMFIVELCLRCTARGVKKFFMGKDRGWAWFDLVMVIVSVIEVFDSLSAATGGDKDAGSLMLRFVRMARLARIMRVLRFSPQLMVMILMILESVKSLMYALVLLALILYVFSICFTMGATEYLSESNGSRKHAEGVNKFYGSIFRSVYTLYKSVTGGQSWGEFLDITFDMGAFYSAVFLFWIAFGVLALLNVITGFFVDGALAKSSQERGLIAEKELSRKKALVQTLKEVFIESDTDRTGTIDQNEFLEHLKDERVAAYLSALKIDTNNLTDLFSEIDGDGSGFVSMDEFVENMQHVMGASSLDQNVQRLLMENRQMNERWNELFSQLKKQFSQWNDLMQSNLLGEDVAPKLYL